MEEGVTNEEMYEMLAALVVQTARLYDLISLLVSEKPHFKSVVEAHARGEVMSPAPYINQDTWKNE